MRTSNAPQFAGQSAATALKFSGLRVVVCFVSLHFGNIHLLARSTQFPENSNIIFFPFKFFSQKIAFQVLDAVVFLENTR